MLTIFLCKAAQFIRLAKQPAPTGVPDDLRRRANTLHPISLNWGPTFAERFTMAESDLLWQRFEILDEKLQAMEPYFMPGYQSGPMRYYFEDMVDPYGVEDFTADWS
mgnify:CR=1 FL=1